MVVVKQSDDNFLNFVGNVGWEEFFKASALLSWEIKFHVARNFLKLLQEGRVRRPKNVVNFLDLVHFVVAGEQGEQGKHFEENATEAPVVHLVIVVAISHQALGRAIPTRGDVLSERRLRIHASTAAEIG